MDLKKRRRIKMLNNREPQRKSYISF